MFRFLFAKFALLAAMIALAAPALAAPPPPRLADAAVAPVAANVAAAMPCADLLKVDFTRLPEAPTALLGAEEVPATASAKAYCRVTGYVQPQIGFELRLPVSSWNGRYFQVGCGGLCGVIHIENCGPALARDFAVAANNLGHVSDSWTDPLWAIDPMLREGLGRRSTHAVAVAAKAILTTYYGKKPAFSYFQGCSTGGREGLSEALHYPTDFNGIIAGDPAFPGRLALSSNWNAVHLLDDRGKAVFSPAKLALLHAAVLKGCDGIDGLKDGIIEDPRACRFAPRTLLCPGGDGPDCLSAAQVAAAEALYAGPRDSKGLRYAPGGSPYGSELSWDGDNRREISQSNLRYLAFREPNPDYDYRTFNFDTDPPATAPQAAIYDPVAPGEAPDLAAFQAAGGKLLAYHGWADPGVPPEGTLDFYARVARAQGGLAAVQPWFRLFMVSGMFHCRGGDAPNTFDLLSPIMAWVEQGQAPNGILATQYNPDKSVKRTRPLYAYPSVARYTGKGDVNDAGNWREVKPAKFRDDAVDWAWAPKN
ncbi:tannase/feruloyl esterase family alpha/beta hydrolase [Novosphingobium album (ex Liu et al. 2023)]|uniref:Tannase/feruloyl esterase family alpha/beta hydrolase n=1 Tax=Novosphingobium album (ex Liu et al. 2023) TaxID=3031130 RepID=A0ABT5WNB1_9SPHN|nr:tannase/feruloyl esterase family alpha/beta hydrolase [Novosphingobium album (ex Liu et al. 2023)]MDE8651529.1 tannase/feruloyl esterase family alpha/beta hydrolase [Novosphingobium album (ex Liu et al. 2023)]